MTSNHWLELKNINICHKQEPIIKNINLSLSIGEHTVLLGANGSGKSTLINTIVKLKYPIHKKNSYLKLFNSNNLNIWELRSKIGFVCTQIEHRIKTNMKTQDIILSGLQGTFGLVNKGKVSPENNKSFIRVIDNLKIDFANKYYRELSDGQKRKVLIARALINQPEILILDEPTTNLDLKANYSLLCNLRELSKGAVTLLYATNDLQTIIPEINRIVLLKRGEIIDDGQPSEVMTSFNISTLYDYNLKLINKDGYWRAFPKV